MSEPKNYYSRGFACSNYGLKIRDFKLAEDKLGIFPDYIQDGIPHYEDQKVFEIHSLVIGEYKPRTIET